MWWDIYCLPTLALQVICECDMTIVYSEKTHEDNLHFTYVWARQTCKEIMQLLKSLQARKRYN